MTRHGSGMRYVPCLLASMTWLVVGGSAAAWATTGPSQADERGPRLQITAPGKMARLPQPPQQIDLTTTASIPAVSADQRVERAFASPTKSEIALGLVPDWAAPAFVAHLTPPSFARPQEDATPASAPERPVPGKAVDPRVAFLAFPLGDESALPIERMGGGYLASYIPDPMLQIEPDEAPAWPETPPEAPSQALTTPPEALPEPVETPAEPAEAPSQAPTEALTEPVEAQPEPPETPSRPPVAEAATPVAESEARRSAKTEAPAAPVLGSPSEELTLPPSLLPTRPL